MNYPYADLNDKYVLVTGASSGIGRAISISLSYLGAKVILVARDHIRLNETLNLLNGNDHFILPMDLFNIDVIEQKIIESIPSSYKIYGFVHAAGIESTVPFIQNKVLDFDKMLKLNVISGFEIARILFKKYKHKETGSFIFVSSIMSTTGAKGKVSYSASKGALISGVRSISLELARYNYRVNCISPGMVKTEMMTKMEKDLPIDALNKIKDLHPLGFGTTEDISNAILFLLSKTSSWITGTNMIIDGGYSAQ